MSPADGGAEWAAEHRRLLCWGMPGQWGSSDSHLERHSVPGLLQFSHCRFLLILETESAHPSLSHSVTLGTRPTVTGIGRARLVAELEKVRAVDRGPWPPAAGSEMPTMNVTKLGSPRDFSFRKASTAGDPDFTWERSQGWRYAFCTAGHLGQQPLSWT